MSTFMDTDGVIHDIPGIVIDAEIPDEQLVADAIAALEKAETIEAEASPSRWAAADHFTELKRRGLKQTEIAVRCQVSDAKVSKYLACARNFSVRKDRPPFWHAYEQVNSEKSGNGDDGGGGGTAPLLDSNDWHPDEQALLKRLQSGETIVVNQSDDKNLIAWARNEGLYEKIDRTTDWGNPFKLDDDGDRDTVIASYAEHYLPYKPSLLGNISELHGKALGCWCAPEPCHGDILAAEADR